MQARLICKSRSGTSIDCPFEGSLTIGRGSERGRTPGVLHLDHEMISARHAVIEWDPQAGCFMLEDHSSNGTMLDGVPVRGRERLDNVHVISLAGEYEFIFRPGTFAAPAAPAAPATAFESPAPFAPPAPVVERPETRLDSTARPASFVPLPVTPAATPGVATVLQPGGGRFVPPPAGDATVRESPAAPIVPPAPSVAAVLRFEVRVPGIAPGVHELRPGRYRVGRLAENDIVVAHPTVSKVHAELVVEAERVLVQNMSQNSRTFFRGVAIQECELRRGTRVYFGEVEALLS